MKRVFETGFKGIADGEFVEVFLHGERTELQSRAFKTHGNKNTELGSGKDGMAPLNVWTEPAESLDTHTHTLLCRR